MVLIKFSLDIVTRKGIFVLYSRVNNLLTMFKQVKLTILEALIIKGYVQQIKEGVVAAYQLPPFVIVNRLSRQISKLSVAQVELESSQKGILEGILTEEGLKKKVESVEKKKAEDKSIKKENKGATIADILTKKQLEEFNEAYREEQKSEVTVGILSEDFSELFDDCPLPIETMNVVSEVIEIFDRIAWNPVKEAAVEEA